MTPWNLGSLGCTFQKGGFGVGLKNRLSHTQTTPPIYPDIRQCNGPILIRELTLKYLSDYTSNTLFYYETASHGNSIELVIMSLVILYICLYMYITPRYTPLHHIATCYPTLPYHTRFYL